MARWPLLVILVLESFSSVSPKSSSQSFVAAGGAVMAIEVLSLLKRRK
jgi:hypothetical protein